MNIDLGPEAEAFRAEVRAWLEDNTPDPTDIPVLGEDDYFYGSQHPWAVQWMQKLREGGWLCVSWPKEYGGRGLTGVEVAVLNEEFHRAGVPRITLGMGESLVGPSVIVWGTAEQQAYFLPRIVSGEDVYCQGFSEPNSGSDLASLRTKGVVYGDEIVIDGQKVWTSGSHRANAIFVLCRTNPDAPKHQGISFVLCPMKDNGVTLRPLRQMTERSDFSETFLDGTRAPLFNVIGGLNNGWKVAMTTLGHERGGTDTIAHLQYEAEFRMLLELARRCGLSGDPVVRQKLAWAFTNVSLIRYAGLRSLAKIAAREEIGPEASITKAFNSEYHRALGDVVMSLLGASGMAQDGDAGVSAWVRTFMQSRAETIYSGTSEIQRNIIGERALGLPKEPKVDERVPAVTAR